MSEKPMCHSAHLSLKNLTFSRSRVDFAMKDSDCSKTYPLSGPYEAIQRFKNRQQNKLKNKEIERWRTEKFWSEMFKKSTQYLM